jgi:hypothetical protein
MANSAPGSSADDDGAKMANLTPSRNRDPGTPTSNDSESILGASYSGIDPPVSSFLAQALEAQLIQLARLFSDLTESGFSCTSRSGRGLLPAKVVALSCACACACLGGDWEGGVVTSPESPLTLDVSLLMPGKLPDVGAGDVCDCWPLGVRCIAVPAEPRFDGLKKV